MKYYIIAGEASGDIHASNLMKELSKKDAAAEFRCWGGDLMKASGGQLVKHYRDLAFMGFVEVLMNLRTIMRNLKFCRNDLINYRPDVLILVDYPGFNLRMAKFAAKQGIRVFYYISPQVWAWKRSRVKAIKRYVERMYVILPFEKEFYRKYDYEVDFVGHPLLDAIQYKPGVERDLKKDLGLGPEPVIAIIPGSRKQEIRTMLPVMLQMVKNYPGHQFVVAAAPSQDERLYNVLVGDGKAKVISSRMHDILRVAAAAMVTSGTATLETALFRVPEVVCYKGGWISYFIARWLVRDIQYISLVNLIMDREVVKELIQGNFTPKTLHQELSRILADGPARHSILDDLDELRVKLGGPGASQATAELMFNRLKDAKIN